MRTGDVVTRLLGGSIPMALTVTAVDDEFIHCGPWKFYRAGGFEVDEELGWGPATGITGSFLILAHHPAREARQ